MVQCECEKHHKGAVRELWRSRITRSGFDSQMVARTAVRIALLVAVMRVVDGFSMGSLCCGRAVNVVMQYDGEATRDASPLVDDSLVAAAVAQISASQAAAVQSLVAANNMYPSAPIDVPTTSGVARVCPFIPEAPKKDSTELGLEASRALAEERQAPPIPVQRRTQEPKSRDN